MDNPVLRSSDKQNTDVLKFSIPKECLMLRGCYSFKHSGLITGSKTECLYIIHPLFCSITYCGQIIVTKSDQQSVLSSHD